MMGVRNEVMVQKKLYSEQDSNLPQQNIPKGKGDKPYTDAGHPIPKKAVPTELHTAAKKEYDGMSIASVKTTNTRSKLIDPRKFKHEEFTEKHSNDNADTDSQISQNNVMINAKIKDQGKIFEPATKTSDDFIVPEGSETVNIKILAADDREISKNITLTPVPEAPTDRNYILADTKDGRTLTFPLDVDALAKQINEEVDPNQDLLWSLRCYIIEVITKSIYIHNLFS